ncbi:MAG: PPOX class F420-dependent oxidoreductase [Chloroflexi bacterium]|nr:MAG: PPOX class F420-dependent oxidoreductase [Chloroflexota bacterium]
MSRAETLRFLSDGARTAKLATTLRDGAPHIVPVWFLIDNERLVFMTWHESVKARSLRRDSRIAICVDDDKPPFAFVAIQGRASISTDPGKRARFARLIAARYMGPTRAEEFGARNDIEGELVITVTPERIVARAELAN